MLDPEGAGADSDSDRVRETDSERQPVVPGAGSTPAPGFGESAADALVRGKCQRRSPFAGEAAPALPVTPQARCEKR